MGVPKTDSAKTVISSVCVVTTQQNSAPSRRSRDKINKILIRNIFISDNFSIHYITSSKEDVCMEQDNV